MHLHAKNPIKYGSAIVMICLLLLFSAWQSASPELNIPVQEVPEFPIGESVVLKGNLADGLKIPDLKWAAYSNVACFPATRFIEFEGNQVFYEVTIPIRAELKATVTPTGVRKRINIYGYINYDGSNVPPISYCRTCEAGYEIYAGNPNLKAKGKPRSISFGQAVNKSFTALIVVSGARDVTEGDYELELSLSPM